MSDHVPVLVPSPPPGWWGRFRRSIASLLVLTFALTTLSVVPAQAAVGGGVTYAGELYGYGVGYWVGSYKLNNGEVVFCAMQPGNNIDPAAVYLSGRSKPTYGAIKRVTSWTGVKPSGGKVTVSGATLARVSYAMSKWGDATTKTRAVAVKRLTLAKTGVGMTSGQDTNTRWAADLMDDMWAESAKFYGPYTAQGSLAMRSDQKYADLSNIGVKSKAGNWVPGYEMTLKITGSALWAANDTKTLKINSQSSGISRRIDIRNAGDVSVDITISGLPDHALNVREVEQSSISGITPQDVMVTGKTRSVSKSVETTATASMDIKTTTSHATTTPGSSITDVLSVSMDTGMWPSSTPVTVTSTLWGPLAKKPTQSASVPSGTPKVGSVTTRITGPGTYRTPAIKLPNQQGYFVWTETTPKTGDIKAWSGRFGVPSEITYANWATVKYSIATQTSAATASRGAVVTDELRVTASGTWPTNHGVTVTSTLYGPFATRPAETSAVPSGAPKVGSVTTRITGPGTYRTPGVTIPSKSGFYVWHETAPATAYTPAWSGRFGVPAETTLVPFQPTVSTIAAEADVDPVLKQARLNDRLTITGGVPNSTVTATARLYFAGESRPSQSPTVPSSAELIDTVTVTATLNGSGAAVVTTPNVVLSDWDQGYYTWVVSLPAGSDGISKAYVSAFGVPSETVFLEPREAFPPRVTTSTSQRIVGPEGDLRDSLTITDLGGVISEDQPLRITSTLWGPLDAYDIGQDVPADAPVVGSVETVVTAAGTVTAPVVMIPDDAPRGAYIWTYSYPKDGGGLIGGSTAELIEYDGRDDRRIYADEVSVYPWSPQVVTQTSDQIAEPGALITDRLDVSGAQPGRELSIESTLYGPFEQRPAHGSTIPDDAPIAGTATTVVTPDAEGKASVVTDGIVVDKRGYFVWHEVIAESDDALSQAWEAVFGQVAETTLVKWQPQVETQTSDADTRIGATLTDTLFVTGVKEGAQIDVTSTLYGPLEEYPELSDEVPAGTPVVGKVTTRVTGNGEFETPGLTIPAGGFYVWAEVIEESDEFLPWASQFGVTSEVSYAKWEPQVTTQASHAIATPGTALHDELVVSGNRSGVSLEIASTLYGPFVQRPDITDEVPVDAPIAGSVMTVIVGNGTVTTDPVVVDEAGFYVWHETIDATDDTAAWSAKFGVVSETTLVQWQPEVSTVTSAFEVAPGAEIYDNIEVTGVDPHRDVEVTSTLYGPFAVRPNESERVPEGVGVVGTVTTTVRGAGEYQTPLLTVSERGFYVWHETIAEAPGMRAWSGRFGVASETTLVKWAPEIQTQTSDPIASVGVALSDHLSMTGGAPGRSYVVTSTLWGPFDVKPELSQDIPDGAPRVGDVSSLLTADKEGKAEGQTPTITLKESGFYVWTEVIAEDDESDGWVSAFGVASEVTLARWQPQVATQTSHQVAEPGSAISDTLMVTGLQPGATVDVVSTLYGPLDDRPELQQGVPAGTPKVDTVSTTVIGDSRGAVTAVTDSVVVTESGFYVWHETIEQSDVHQGWVAPFGQVSETTLVKWQPEVVTRTSHAQTEATYEIHDKLTVTGVQPGAELEVVSTLWGPFDTMPELSDEIPDDAPKVGDVTTVVTGDGEYDTPPLVIPEAGIYTWTETITATQTTHVHQSKFGVAAETTKADPYSGGGGADGPNAGGGGLADTGTNLYSVLGWVSLLVGLGALGVTVRTVINRCRREE